MKYITKKIRILSFVSLFTDMASEMLYPLMPVYLKSIGFSILLIGVLEGIAEAVAGISKGYFGKLSDVSGKRVIFVRAGYFFSAVSKPMMAVFTFPLWIFSARTLDRLGKGIRTGARDALLSDESSAGNKGKVFGFHRSMDTLGAVTGPVIALIYLRFYPEDYKTLFFIAFAPGLIATFLTFLIKEKNKIAAKKKIATPFFSFMHYWKESPVEYRRLVGGLLVFTLFNSSDVFLLMKAKESGLSDTLVIGVYVFYNLVYALFAFPAGIIADRIGMKKIFIIGLAMFVLVYAGMAFTENMYFIIVLFFIYGLYASATEGISKAMISNISSAKDTATALGSYAGFQSICTMFASAMAGLIWYKYGAGAAFLSSAIITTGVIIYFTMIRLDLKKQGIAGN